VSGAVTAEILPPPASTNPNASGAVEGVGARINVRLVDPLKTNEGIALRITATPSTAAGRTAPYAWAPAGTSRFPRPNPTGTTIALIGAAPQTTISCAANLSVTKTAVASSVSVGDDAAFDITVTNSGAATASSVGVSDSLPSGLTWGIDSQGLNGATNGS